MNGHLSWFRLWSDAVDDEKLRLLAFEDRWHFVAILCCKAQGILDESGDLMLRKVSVKLGLQVRELDEVVRRLSEVGLIDSATLQPVAWERRQYASDRSTERVREFRKKKQSETFQKRFRNAAETDTDTEKNPPNPPAGGACASWTPPPGVDPDAWADFETHRREIRRPLTDLSRTKNANALAALPADLQRQAVDATIANRWTGIFPPKANGSNQHKPLDPGPCYREAAPRR